MEDISGNPNSAGKLQISRSSTIAVLVLSFLVGVGIGRFSMPSSGPNSLFDAYLNWLDDSGKETWKNTYWLGVPIQKCPWDSWVYQEIIYETKPDVLIETGTFQGGSALFFASIFGLLKRGRVLTIDIEKYPPMPQNERITYLLGSSTADAIFQQVKNSIRPGERVMVSLDSDHHKDHVLKELKLYSGLVTPGNYLVVEDTANGHPNLPSFGPGPLQAVEEFLKNNSNFTQDKSREKWGISGFRGGWLKRVR